MSALTDDARRVTRVLDDLAEGAEEPAEVDPHPDRVRTFTSMSFARMRTRWTREEEGVIEQAKAQADHELMAEFGDAFIILNNIYEVVRQPRHRSGGEIIRDQHGFPAWETDETGMYVEDYGKLTDRQREDFLHQISIRLVLWEQTAAQMWGEAMFAKAAWEERFAHSFVGSPQVEGKRPTEADRTNYAQTQSWEQRYLSLYMSMRSKQAEALVRGLERLSQRLKDTLR